MADEKINIIINAKDNASKVLGGITNAFASLAKIGIAAAGAAVVGLGAVLGDSVKAAMEAEEIQAQLAAVLKSTGGAAGVTADQVNELATSLSKTTKFEDDAIVAGESMLLTFTNIGKDVFPDATLAMLNMSEAMGQDLKTTAIQLGKALNDPKEGLSALSRVGVKFTEEQKAMIEQMVAVGDIAGAQKIILGELATEFGGSAEAAGNTFAGKLEILKNQIGNVKESIGAALIPVLSDLLDKYVLPLLPAFEKLAGWFGELMAGGIEMPAALQPLMDALNDLFGTIEDSGPMVMESLGGMFDFLRNTWAEIGPVLLNNVAEIVESISALWAEHGDEIMAIVSAAWNVLVLIVTNAINLIMTIINVVLKIIRGDWEGAWLAIKDFFNSFLESVLAMVGTNLDEFTGVWKSNFDNLKTIVSTGIEMAKTAIHNAVSGLVSAGRALVEGIMAGIKAKWDEVVSWLQAQAAKLPAAVKQVLGIKSPSRVFAEIGQNMMLGMGQGIQQAAGVPMTAAARAASNVVSNTYNLTIHEAGARGNVVNDFNLLRSLAGA